MTSTVHSAALGPAQGIESSLVVSFRGVPFATLANRLADAQLIRRSDRTIDAAEYGPAAPSPRGGCELEQRAIQRSLPPRTLPQSDLDCLHLNIAVPCNRSPESQLPVFLFIHGGGYVLGANSWPQFDLERFVQLSVEQGRPIVAITMNYRLGPFGFLTSQELRDAGFNANNGLRDQRTAIEWVKLHIKDFGGDPDNITLAGMSAGGASALFHLHSETALFRRLVVMSGTPLLLQPITAEKQEAIYQKTLEALGLSGMAPKERIQYLLEAPTDEIVTLTSSIPVATTIDGDVIPCAASFESLNNQTPTAHWCEELLIGDAAADVRAYPLSYQEKGNSACLIQHHPSRKPISITELHRPVHGSPLLDSSTPTRRHPGDPRLIQHLPYQSRHHRIPINPAIHKRHNILPPQPHLRRNLAAPQRRIPVLLQRRESLAWSCAGTGNHLLDIAYLFQNFNEFLSPEQRDVARSFAGDVLRFCYGRAPWDAVSTNTNSNTYTQGNNDQQAFTARIYGPSSEGKSAGVVTQAVGEEAGRRGNMLELGKKIPMDTLAQVAVRFKGD